jgi:hypothetical protein
MRQNSLFRWIPAAISLWFCGGLFAVFGVFNFWLSELSARGALPHSVGGGTDNPRSLLHGAVENGAVAAFCILGWYFLRRRIPGSLPGGTLAVTVALLITVGRWLHWQLVGANQLPWLEPMLVWPFFLYAIVYGYRESKASVAE